MGSLSLSPLCLSLSQCVCVSLSQQCVCVSLSQQCLWLSLSQPCLSLALSPSIGLMASVCVCVLA